MQNVLLLIHKDAGQEARFEAAIDIVRSVSGHLSCLDVTPFPAIAGAGIGLAPSMMRDEAERDAGHREDMRCRLEREDLNWSWTDLRDDFIPCLIEAAANADIVVLNRKLESTPRPNMRAITSAVLMHTKAAIVAVDEHCRAFDAVAPALIAWDGSKGLSHAIERALPLLKAAARITVLQVGSLPENAIPTDDVVTFLCEHEMSCDLEQVAASADVAGQIRRTADRIAAGYCVMGAYSHGRLREALLGGVTRDMLETSRIPLFLAH